MKKLLLLIATLAVAFGISRAETYSLTVDIDNAAAVNAVESYYDATYNPVEKPVVLHDGENTFELEQYHSLQITASDGIFIKSCVKKSSGEKMYVGNKKSVSIYASEETDREIFVVTTATESEMRRESVSIKADYPEKINIQRYGLSGFITMDTNPMELRYDPDDELPIIISAKEYNDKIYKVSVSEGNVTENYGRWDVTPTNGAIIDIQFDFPDKDVTFSLKSNTGNFDFLTVRAGAPLTDVDISSGSYTVKAGTPVSYTFDTQNYQINSFTIDGVPNSNLYSYSFNAADDAEHSFDVTPYLEYEVRIVSNMPDKLEVHSGSTYDPVVEAVDGVFTVSRKGPHSRSVSLKVAEGYYIRSVLSDITEGNLPSNPKIFTYETPGACTLTVDVAEIINDRKVALYFDNPDRLNYWQASSALENSIFSEPQNGYNIYEVSSADSPCKISINVKDDGKAEVFYNCEPATRENEWSPWSVEFNGNDVIHVFVDGVPQKAMLSFDLIGGATAEVFHNKVVPVNDLSATTSLFIGDEVRVKPLDENFEILVNGLISEPSSDGTFTFNIDGDTCVTVSKTSGIVLSVTEDSTVRDIYNLQGIRIKGDNLPAGIYICNRKKFKIR